MADRLAPRGRPRACAPTDQLSLSGPGPCCPTGWLRAALLTLFALACALTPSSAGAQTGPRVQVLRGSIQSGDALYYRLADLQAGETLTVHVANVTGNLDPIVGLLAGSADPRAAEAAFARAIEDAVAAGEDPFLSMTAALDRLLLAWDDDSGEGLAAALTFPVPADGDYLLLVTDAPTAGGAGTTGDFRLTIGLNAPDALRGDAAPTGAAIATLDEGATAPNRAVEEITGELGGVEPEASFELKSVVPGDTLYLYVEALGDGLRPAIILHNYADKPLRSANLTGQTEQAALTYPVQDGGSGYSIEVRAGDAGASEGAFRLLAGINAPEVLDGVAATAGEPLIKQPIPVQIGVKLQQMVDVNEPNEFFTAVASLQMEWTDPALAFSPDGCNCLFKVYTNQDFGAFLAETQGHFPEFTIFNQQGNRWTQNRVGVIHHDGRALYFERFSTNLQVDFDFRQYPFDREEFVLIIDSIYPENFFHFTDLAGYSEISEGHGEDEFIIDGFKTAVTSVQASTQSTTSRFTFSFGGPRHLNYYIVQIFLPLLLILAVSWVTFILRDYNRRIEVASANLLVFIAFSFSLAGNYPRLGYITLLDAVMTTIFILSALVVVYNVWLRRMEMNGHAEQANRVDNVLDWVYPATLVGSALLLYIFFF